jgi:hypothetical protein
VDVAVRREVLEDAPKPLLFVAELCKALAD